MFLFLINIIYAYMNNRNVEASGRTIDNYASTEGATWNITREACDLPLKAPHRQRYNGSETPREECDEMRLVELSDALSILAIEQNFEVVMNESGVGALWR